PGAGTRAARRVRPGPRRPVPPDGAGAGALPRVVPEVPAVPGMGGPRYGGGARAPGDPARDGPVHPAGEFPAGAHAGVSEEPAVGRAPVNFRGSSRGSAAPAEAGTLWSHQFTD